MARSRKKPAEATDGRFSAIPDSLLDSVAYQGCSFSAKALLIELVRQHNAYLGNNGHIHAVYEYLHKRGWRSKATLSKALAELIERGLIIKTRQGGFNMGACRYALSWIAVSNFVDLDITAKTYHRGAYLLLNPLPKIKQASTDSRVVNPITSTDSELAKRATYPETVLVNDVFQVTTYPETEHNEYHHIHAMKLDASDAMPSQHETLEFAELAAHSFKFACAKFVKSATTGDIIWH